MQRQFHKEAVLAGTAQVRGGIAGDRFDRAEDSDLYLHVPSRSFRLETCVVSMEWGCYRIRSRSSAESTLVFPPLAARRSPLAVRGRWKWNWRNIRQTRRSRRRLT